MRRYAAAIALAALLAPALAAAEEADVVCVELTRNIGFGATDAAYGGEVSALQGFLGRVGALASEPTGYFGLLTRDAVIAFQESNDIQATGAVDAVTRDVIRRQSCARGEAQTISGAASGEYIFQAGGVTFDFRPVPERGGAKSSSSSSSSKPTGKVKVVMKTVTRKVTDGEATVAVSVAPRSTNDQVEIWELNVDCNDGAVAYLGSRDVCGEVVSKYAYALDAPDKGFALATLSLVNERTKRNTVTLRLEALDADGNVMSKEVKRVRVSAAPEEAEE
jgi:peptidoglycan hydrolase-like protein with peptidoglycan-binding domain